MLRLPLVTGLIAALACGVALAPRAAVHKPVVLLVGVRGTMAFSFTSDVTQTYGGGACSFELKTTGSDTLRYATGDPIRVPLEDGAGSARVPVDYTLTLHPGTMDAGSPTGTAPDGTPCQAVHPPAQTAGCRDFSGRISLRIEVAGGRLTVSSKGHGFPSEPCSGGHTALVRVLAATARLPAHLAGKAHGSATEATTTSVRGGTTSYSGASSFTATVALR